MHIDYNNTKTTTHSPNSSAPQPSERKISEFEQNLSSLVYKSLENYISVTISRRPPLIQQHINDNSCQSNYLNSIETTETQKTQFPLLLEEFGSSTITEILKNNYSNIMESEIVTKPGTLSFLIQRSGPTVLSSGASFKSSLASLNISAIDDREIAKSIIIMARTSSDPPSGSSMWGPSTSIGDSIGSSFKWDSKIFVSCIKEKLPKLDWDSIYKSFDSVDFFCGDLRALEVYISIYRIAIPDSPFPISAFYGKWKNSKGQISFLKWATQAPKDIIDLVHLSQKRILLPESVASAPPSTRVIATGWLQQQWNSLELLHTIINVASEETGDSAKQLLDFASRQATELVLIGLCQISLPWSDLHKDVVFRLITALLVGHSSAIFVLIRVWALNKTLIISAMINYYRQEPNCLSRLLDIAQDLKALSVILEEKAYPFVIDLAALAARREYLNLEKWLSDNIATYHEAFAKECLNFLQIKMGINKASPPVIPLSNEAFVIFFKVLQNNANFTANFQNSLHEITNLATQMIPALSGNAQTGVVAETNFPQDVEETANSLYEKIYTGELPLPNLIEMLKKFQNSSENKEKLVFECMIRSLFDEFRFFHKYPDRELLVTGELFGSLIKYEFLTSAQLAVALRYVLDSLQRPLGTKMFRFGISGLAQFQNRLPEWPQYCSHLLQISQLHDAHPDIYRAINQALSNPVVKVGSGEDEDLTGSKPGSTGPLNSEALTLRTVEHKAPSAAVQDRLLFLLNNLSDTNLSSKMQELKSIVNENVYGWLSNYLVVKRVSIEPNYHELYLNLLDGLSIPDFVKTILDETYSNIKVLLVSEKALSSAQERSLLKNLGSWLGALTLAKDKPIKHKDLPMKQLLIEAYAKNRLIVTIPFVCKVLEQCKSSKVFKAPNPWLMALLKLLMEFYHFADLKLNLKFEVEVLCRNIDVELKEIEPSEILRMIKYEQDNQLIADPYRGFNNANIKGVSQAVPDNAPQVVFDETGQLSIVNLANFVVFNSNIPIFNSHPALKKVVMVALEKAIREIIGPVVERSVSIAVVTTREIVAKDFAPEPNDERMRRAAQLMAQNLSGSLAQVTSKEPLKNSFANNLRILFQQSGLNDVMVENIIAITVQDNLNLGCAIIEKMAMDKSVPEINNELAQAYLARRRQRERGMPWVEPPSQFANFKYPAMLPDILRWNPNSIQQARIYEDFHKSVNYVNPAPTGLDGGLRVPLMSPNEPPVNPLQQITEKISVHLNDLDTAIRNSGESVVADLPANHEIISLVRQINLIISQFAVRDEISLWFSQSLVDLLFKTESSFGREIYIILLERISELSRRVARELFVWLLFSDDERKYNIDVSVALIQSGLLNSIELDSYLAKEMESVRLPLIEYATKLIQKCLMEDIVTPNEFHYSILSLAKLSVGNHLPESMSEIINDIRQRSPGLFISQDNEVLSRKESLIILFDEWVRSLQKNKPDVAWTQFLPMIKEKKVLDDEELFAAFIRYSTEVSIDTYYKLRNAPGGAIIGYQVIDSLANLIVAFLKNVYKTDEMRVIKFSRILSILALVTIHMHEVRRELFDQKPFFRLFSGILEDLNSSASVFTDVHFSLITAFGNTLRVLNPSRLPGFIFAWLELVSHRLFMSKLLQETDKVGWKLLHDLIVDMFSFMTPFLRHADMSDPIRVLYKGLLRVLLLLLHDFPEFLCDYHFSLCDLIPPSCIQLRNLILSAFPRNMRLPDPFTPNLKVDLLPEINKPPVISSDYTLKLQTNDLLTSVDSYLSSRSPLSFLEEVKQKLLLSPDDTLVSGTNYDIPLINALVLHVGVQAIQQMQNKSSGTGSNITQSAPMDIFQKLVMDLDAEGRYHFINAIANQLRYPNSHTHYFSCVLLYLFAESNNEVIQEQITRVLLERLIVNRPHPWGLLITFIELLKNPRYNFWNHSFTRCAADIERLFESVARSCMIPQVGPAAQ